MRYALVIVSFFWIIAFAGYTEVNIDICDRSGDWLTYDNGSAEWLSWEGIYRGVWFNLEDFVPGWIEGVDITMAEVWFYHSDSFPWDTSDFYLEVWNGDVLAPAVQLDQVKLTAVHYAPVNSVYMIPITVENNFWVLTNTELSSGGWPSILSDSDDAAVSHSFLTDDFILWTPYIQPTGISNYITRVLPGDWSLDAITWGSLKAVF